MDRLHSIHRECTAIATALYDVCVRVCIINFKKWKLYDESDKNYAERKKPNMWLPKRFIFNCIGDCTVYTTGTGRH